MISHCIGLSLLRHARPAAGGELLRAEARRVLSLLEGRPLEETDIAREENGRPFFPGRETDFSISHSHNMVAVSLAKGGTSGKANPRTGCDVQLIRPRPRMREIAEKFFSAAEKEYVFHKGEGQADTDKFFQIWVLKECFLKLRGLSVFDMAGVPSFIRGGASGCLQFAFDAPVPSPLLFNLYELAGVHERYMLALVLEACADVRPEERWFSQPLNDKSIVEIKAAPPITHSPSFIVPAL